LGLQSSQADGIDKFLAGNGLDAILYPGAGGAGIGAKAGYSTAIAEAVYLTLTNLDSWAISFLGKAYHKDDLLGLRPCLWARFPSGLASGSTPALASLFDHSVAAAMLAMAIGDTFFGSRCLCRRLSVVVQASLDLWFGPGELLLQR
jgi:hypothetical protein